MKYTYGTEPLKPGTQVKVWISPEQLKVAGRKYSFSISVSAIKGVYYGLGNFRSFDRQMNKEKLMRVEMGLAGLAGNSLSEPGLKYLFATPPLTAGLYSSVLLMNLAAESLRHSYVTIIWGDQWTENLAALKFSPQGYEAFVSELQHFAGPKWRDLLAERKKLRQDLDREKAHSIVAQIPTRARAGSTVLQPGTYRLILLRKTAGCGELYFFHVRNAGKVVAAVVVPYMPYPSSGVGVRKIVAAAVVDLEPHKSAIESPEIVFAEGEAPRKIAEIRTGSLRMVFRSAVKPPSLPATSLPQQPR